MKHDTLKPFILFPTPAQQKETHELLLELAKELGIDIEETDGNRSR